DVEEVLVIGIADRYRGEAAKAFIKLRPGASPLTLDALRDFLADKIGRHEMPAGLEIRTALPRTSVGKLSKRELIEEEQRKSPHVGACSDRKPHDMPPSSPLVGEGWGGGSGGCGNAVPPLATPAPGPSPQGGGEKNSRSP